MTKSALAQFVRASAKAAKADGYSVRVYGLDRITPYGFVSKEGSFWPLNENRLNSYVVRLIANTIGMNQHSKEHRKAVLNAIKYFKGVHGL